MAILSRWTAMKNAEGKPVVDTKRPYLATECDNVKDCNRWRKQIIGQITKKVMAIQNAGMGEFRLRDLNDEINKLLREKIHWEDRILELGGPDYGKVGPKLLDADGKELPGNRGYKYFGAAKDLPGVRELFAQEAPRPPRKTRFELYKNIDADYYGYRDDDDGVLVPLETDMETQVRKDAILEWKEKVASGEITVEDAEEDKNRYLSQGDDTEDTGEIEDEDGEGKEKGTEESNSEHFISHVPVPSQKDVEELLLRRKKQELMDRYASDYLQAQSTQARALLG